MGKTKGETSKEDAGAGESSYTPMPISSLRDPASFASPPKRTVTAGRASPGTNPAGGSAYARPAAQRQEPEPEEERPPPQPYRRDTTGLSTAHLPPPPGRRDGADGRAPAPASAVAPKPPATKPKLSLPPRLPPRQTEHVDEHTPAAPPPYSLEAGPPAHQGILNQNAMNRLGAAGVSVPGFNIAPNPSPPLPSRRQAAAPPPPVSPQKPSTSQLGELQSRFARLGTSSPQKEHPATTSQGTTWAQKQAALKTASSFRNDPSSISFSDARNAASTVNNVRERHGEQVASGLQSANNLNNKYGLNDKAAAYGVGSRVSEQARDSSSGINMDGHAHSVASKKPPPPPPKKKPDLVGTQQGSGPPPPIPHSSKPKPPVSSYKY